MYLFSLWYCLRLPRYGLRHQAETILKSQKLIDLDLDLPLTATFNMLKILPVNESEYKQWTCLDSPYFPYLLMDAFISNLWWNQLNNICYGYVTLDVPCLPRPWGKCHTMLDRDMSTNMATSAIQRWPKFHLFFSFTDKFVKIFLSKNTAQKLNGWRFWKDIVTILSDW